MENHRIRYGAISGLALAALFIIAFALDLTIIGSTGGNPVLDPGNIGPDLLRAQDSTPWLIEGWVYTLAVVATPMFMLAAYWTLRDDRDRGLPAVGLVAAVIFWILHTIHNATIVTVLAFLAPSYVGGERNAAITEGLAATLVTFANVNFSFGLSVGLVFLVSSLAALGVATLRGRHLPTWTGYAALVSAALMSISVFGGQTVIAGILGWVLFITWVIGTSTSMARSGTTGTSVAAATQAFD